MKPVFFPVYKGKSTRTMCANYKCMVLLSPAGKVLENIIPTCLTRCLVNDVLSEILCGFRSGIETIVMIFTSRLMQKFYKRNMDHVQVFLYLTKSFDTENRALLWRILGKN